MKMRVLSLCLISTLFQSMLLSFVIATDSMQQDTKDNTQAMPPPKTPPTHLKDAFSMNNTVPIEYFYVDDTLSGKGTHYRYSEKSIQNMIQTMGKQGNDLYVQFQHTVERINDELQDPRGLETIRALTGDDSIEVSKIWGLDNNNNDNNDNNKNDDDNDKGKNNEKMSLYQHRRKIKISEVAIKVLVSTLKKTQWVFLAVFVMFAPTSRKEEDHSSSASNRVHVSDTGNSVSDSTAIDWTDYDKILLGAKVGIFGSTEPWLESFLISVGAESVYTIEFNKLTYGHPRMITVHKDDFPVFFADHAGSFDILFSISSFDHTGLGRYGDPIDPEGDITQGMSRAMQLLKPHGTFFLTVPIGPDVTVWNLHRRYGHKRLPLLLQGWRQVGMPIGWRQDLVDKPANWRQTHEPVFVLQKR